jgi:hypothetical protein
VLAPRSLLHILHLQLSQSLQLHIHLRYSHLTLIPTHRWPNWAFRTNSWPNRQMRFTHIFKHVFPTKFPPFLLHPHFNLLYFLPQLFIPLFFLIDAGLINAHSGCNFIKFYLYLFFLVLWFLFFFEQWFQLWLIFINLIIEVDWLTTKFADLGCFGWELLEHFLYLLFEA